VADLVDEGYVERTRVGRRNTYAINADAPLRHRLARDHSIGEVLEALAPVDPA
jgi:hypothetical protein